MSEINTVSGPINVENEMKETQEIVKEALNKQGPVSAEHTQEVSEALKNPDDPTLSPAGMYGLYLPRFIDLCNSLSKKGVNRVVRSLIAYPLEDLKPNFKEKNEKEAYQIGLRLLEARFVLTLAMGLKEQERIQEEQAKAKEKENNVSTTNEETKD